MARCEQSPDERLVNLYHGYKRLYDVEKARTRAIEKKRIVDEATKEAVKHYRSQTLNAENTKALQKQVLLRAGREREARAVSLAQDAQMRQELAANAGLVQVHPAITFTPEQEALRQKKEQ